MKGNNYKGKAMLSRRWFIGGAAAFGAFGGTRFAKAKAMPSGEPRLRFGVVSDIHIKCSLGADAADEEKFSGTFRHTLECFRDRGVDAVVIAGDLADNGIILQLEHVAATWRQVFPNDKAPDGRRVERLFVYGNHDMGGLPFGRGRLRGMSDEEIGKRIILSDPKGVWERVFDEPYVPIWTKEVRGYRFVGAQWLVKGCRGRDERFNDGIADFYAANSGKFDPSLPFFHVQHPHPKDTCYGPWAWGCDAGLATKALSAFPNAIALSGHSHYSLTDERSVWQGAFTSVGTASLLYLSDTYDENSPEGFDNTSACGSDAQRIDAAKMTPRMYHTGRQGMVWSVYDDCIVVERTDYMHDQRLGDDWVMPLPATEPRPFAFAARAKKFRPPRFPDGARLGVERVIAKNRGGKDIPAVEREAVRITIPAVVPDKDARAHRFKVVGAGGGANKVKYVAAECSSNAPGHPRSRASTKCVFATADFPPGEVVFTVTPENCFFAAGAPITAKTMIGGRMKS